MAQQPKPRLRHHQYKSEASQAQEEMRFWRMISGSYAEPIGWDYKGSGLLRPKEGRGTFEVNSFHLNWLAHILARVRQFPEEIEVILDELDAADVYMKGGQ